MSDYYGPKARIGIIVPSTNTTAQPEFEWMRPSGITNHIGRMEIRNIKISDKAGYDEFTNNIKKAVSQSIRTLTPCNPSLIIIAMSPESFWENEKQHQQLKKRLEMESDGISISMAPEAYLDALHSIDIGDKKTRIGLITPYVSHGSHKSAQFFEENGYQVTKIYGFGCTDLVNIAHITKSDMEKAVNDLNCNDVDAIVQIGSNIPMSVFASNVEQHIGKPVLSNNTVSYRYALKNLDKEIILNENVRNKFFLNINVG